MNRPKGDQLSTMLLHILSLLHMQPLLKRNILRRPSPFSTETSLKNVVRQGGSAENSPDDNYITVLIQLDIIVIMYVRMCMYIPMYEYVCIMYMYINMYVCMYVCIYV